MIGSGKFPHKIANFSNFFVSDQKKYHWVESKKYPVKDGSVPGQDPSLQSNNNGIITKSLKNSFKIMDSF